MSTYWHFECLDHTPPLGSMEFTQHTEDAAFWAGVDLIAQRPVQAGLGGYFERNASVFLSEHPECVIELVSEYGERRDADGTNPRWTSAGRRDLVESIEPMFGDTVTIPRPVVPHGPAHLTVDAGTAHYLREVVRKIDTGFLTVGGSNVTATVRKLLLDSAAALEVSSGE